MKSLTTILVERHQTDAPPEGLKIWRDAAQAQIPEPVIDACLFSRPSSYAASKAAGSMGYMFYKLLKKTEEVQAGGLPQHFLLAVTETEVIALRRTMKACGPQTGEPGEEVARWQRSALNVSWKVSGYQLPVTISSPGEDEKVQCMLVKSPISESFLHLLSDPSATEPARG